LALGHKCFVRGDNVLVAWMHLLTGHPKIPCNEGDEGLIIIGAPMDWTTSYKPGTRFGPKSIRDAICNLEFFSMIMSKPVEDLVLFNDLGDIALPPGDVMESLARIKKVVKGVREDYSENFIVLGGEHLITLPIVESISDGIDLIVVIDAHLDQRDQYLGNKYSHATVMRRIIEKTKIPIIYVGARAISPEEYQYVEAHRDKIKIYTPSNIDRDDGDQRKELVEIIKGKRIYLSIDMDGIDPGFAPGVSNPEPMGLNPINAIELLRLIHAYGKLVAGDIVEVNPLEDINDITSLLAAKLLVEITTILRRE